MCVVTLSFEHSGRKKEHDRVGAYLKAVRDIQFGRGDPH